MSNKRGFGVSQILFYFYSSIVPSGSESNFLLIFFMANISVIAIKIEAESQDNGYIVYIPTRELNCGSGKMKITQSERRTQMQPMLISIGASE